MWYSSCIREKNFFVTYEWAEYAGVFVPGRPLQPSVMFVSKARAYLSVACKQSFRKAGKVKHFSLWPKRKLQKKQKL